MIDEAKIEIIPVNELFKISVNEKNATEAMTKLKEQYNSANLDIQNRFEDKVLKFNKVMICYQAL